jgi:hypothetical protein
MLGRCGNRLYSGSDEGGSRVCRGESTILQVASASAVKNATVPIDLLRDEARWAEGIGNNPNRVSKRYRFLDDFGIS